MSCEEAPGLVIEKNRLKAIGGNFLGIIGDANHSFGAHLCNPPAGDYSLSGAANKPVGTYACAIDIGMNWAASRKWLAWLITEIREDRIKGIFEVIGSLDGKSVRYWSDTATPGWQQNGVAYTGKGHDTWTHVAIYRSTALDDHKILAGWTATGLAGQTDTGGTVTTPTTTPGYEPIGYPKSMLLSGKERGTALQTADNWGQEHFGHSPYDEPGKFTESYRSARLRRIEENTTFIKTVLEDTNVEISLEDSDIAAIAQLVADQISDNLADKIADKLAARLQQ